jgi:putative transposase
MSRNFYSEIHLHIVWHTKESAPLLTPSVEPVAHRHIVAKARQLPGIYFHEIGGTETHVHLAVRIVPAIRISEMIGQLKGYSAHETNREWAGSEPVLHWQDGYGAVSFGTRNLPWVTSYIRNQKSHHANGTIEDRLERIVAEDEQWA